MFEKNPSQYITEIGYTDKNGTYLYSVSHAETGETYYFPRKRLAREYAQQKLKENPLLKRSLIVAEWNISEKTNQWEIIDRSIEIY